MGKSQSMQPMQLIQPIQSKQSKLNSPSQIPKLQDKIDISNPLIHQLAQLPFKFQSILNPSRPNTLSFEQKIATLKGKIFCKERGKEYLHQEFNLDYAFADSSIAGICLMKNCNAVVVIHGEFIKLWYLDDMLPSRILCIGDNITGVSITNNEKYIIYSTERTICAWDYGNNEQYTFPFESFMRHCQIIPSKDDKYIACGLSEHILLFDSQSMEKKLDATLERQIIECIALTNDNKYILAVVTQKYIRDTDSSISGILIYSLLDQNIIKEIDWINLTELTIKISDDNAYLVTDSNDKTIRVWNLQLILNNFENFQQFQGPEMQYSIIQRNNKKFGIPNNENAKESENLKYKISEKEIKVLKRNQYRFEITKDNKYLLIYNETINEFQLYDIITMSLEKRINHKGNSSNPFLMMSYDFSISSSLSVHSY